MNLEFTPTANFNLESDPKLACCCGHPECDHRVVKPIVVNALQRVREDFKQSMIITSGGRCEYHPEVIKRVVKNKDEGKHFTCEAVDIWYDGTQAMYNALLVLLGRHGVTSVAASGNFIHADWREVGSTRVPTWTYVNEITLTR